MLPMQLEAGLSDTVDLTTTAASQAAPCDAETHR